MVRRQTQKKVKKLRRRFPRWSYLTDEQLIIAAQILATARVKFNLENARYEIAGRTVEEQTVAL